MKSSTKAKLKDWLTINRIRIMNFIKEHKYLSLVIGLFLVSIVVALTVRAANDELSDAGDFKVNSFLVSTDESTEASNSAIADNFSSANYVLEYRLGTDGCTETTDFVDTVTITATFTDQAYAYAKWKGTTEEAVSEIDGKKLTLKIPSVPMCTPTRQNLSFTILNAKKDSSVGLSSLKLQPGSGAKEVELLSATDNKHANVPTLTTTYSDDKVLDGSLIVEPISGAALKNSSGGRNAKFGLMLGFYSDSFQDIINNGITTLKGSYISDDIDIFMSASETTSSGKNLLDLSTASGDYGVYTSDMLNKHYFQDLPVLTSGTVGTMSKGLITKEEVIDYNFAPVVSLKDNKELIYEVHPTSSTEKTITKRNIIVDGSEKECTKANNCTFDDSEVNLTEAGTYYATYKVTDKNNTNNSTTLRQKITVTSNKNDSKGLYTLKGPQTIYLSSNNFSFTDPGLDKVDGNTANYPVRVKYKFEDNSENDGLNALVQEKGPGTYTQTYTINDPSSEDSVVTTINRTIVVGDTNFTSDSYKVTSKSITAQGTEYNGKDLVINDKEAVACNSSSYCKSSLTSSDYESTGEKTAIYTITKDDQIITIQKTIEVKPTYYKLPITGLTLSDQLEVKNINNRNFFVLGTYFVTVPTTSEASTIELSAFTKTNELNPKTASTVNVKNSTGNNSLTNDIYVNENESYVKVTDDTKDKLTGNYYTAAMGEQVRLQTIYNYGADADGDMTNLKILLDINKDHMIPVAINSDSTTPYYKMNFEYYGEELNIPMESISIKYCTSPTSCNIDPESYNQSNDTITNIEISVSEKIPAGTTIKLRTDYLVKTITDSSVNLNDQAFNSIAHVSFKSGDINVSSDGTNTISSKNVYITPYKVRTNTYLGKGDSLDKTDITLDATKNDIYTLYASTSVTAPAMALNSNIFGYEKLNTIPVKFILPSGINYVYNADYEVQPDDINGIARDAQGNTILTYTYQGVEPNSWIEAIYFDFNIDVTVQDKSTLQIITQIGDWNTVSLANDLSSSSKDKTNISSVTVLNNEKIAYGQYAYNDSQTQVISSIDKNGKFVFKTKLHNNQDSVVTNAYVYTVLPYIDSEEIKYNGTYDIDLPANASCTTDPQSAIMTNASEVQWDDCNTVKASGKLTAFRVHYPTINASETKEAVATISTSNNKPDDIYLFKSYLIYDGLMEQLSFQNLSVSVVSKKITGTVWEDFNDNGIMDDTEKKIENVTLNLFKEDGTLVDTTSPNKNGIYTFSGFNEGNYYITADFNTEKYSLTTSLESYTDLSKVSVFKSDSNQVVKPDEPKEETQDKQDDNTISRDEQEKGEDEVLPDGSSGDIPNDEEEDEEEQVAVVKTNIITITPDTRTISNINLGLSLRKKFQVKLNKYITSAEATNKLGLVTRRDYGNAKLAKLDVKDINNLSIKVVYTIEIENIKYYPGYIKAVNETVPDGMVFNENYAENKDWFLNEDGTLTNISLANDLLEEGQKVYLNIAFDIVRKEAGSFINTASVDDLEILGGTTDEE